MVSIIVVASVTAVFVYVRSPYVSRQANQDTESLITSHAPEGKDIGFIYGREAKISDEILPSDEFALFDISKQSLTTIDTSRPLAWQGTNGEPIILYSRMNIANEPNTFTVSAFDLTSSFTRGIKLPDEVNAYSSIAYSPVEKKVAHCVANETVFNVLDLVSGRKDAFPSFTGCLANNSFNPPHFSPDGTEIYYQTFGSNEDGTYNHSFYKYQKLSLATGRSTITPPETSPTNLRFDTDRKWLAEIRTAGNDVESYSNQLAILDLSAVSPDSVSSVIKEQTAPLVARKTLGSYVHIGTIQRTGDGAGFFFYTFVQKGYGSGERDFQIGFFDNDNKTVTYPIGSVPTGYGSMSLLGSHEKEFVVFGMQNRSTELDDVFYASVSANAVTLVDRGTRLFGGVYFVEEK